jgi:hypothetical protein
MKKKIERKKKCHYKGACYPNNPFEPKDCKKCSCYW